MSPVRNKQIARKYLHPNNVTFPRALREAIPDHEPSIGRCLKLDSVDAQPAHTVEWGRRVQVKLNVCETGKLHGVFDVWVDMELDAAKALASLIQTAAEQAEKLSAVSMWRTQ
jgi:hypothetical protein